MSNGPRTVFRGIGLSSGTDDPSTAVISRIYCPGVVLVQLWAQVWGEPLPSLSIPNGMEIGGSWSTLWASYHPTRVSLETLAKLSL